jgi:large subunit ribosomal protein L24
MPGVDIRKEDTVKVIAGKDVGHQGRVVRVDPRKGLVLVEGAGRARKHTRTGSKRSTSGQTLQQGGIIDMEQPIAISNVQVVCKTCNKPTRVGHRVDSGHKARVCKQCGADL